MLKPELHFVDLDRIKEITNKDIIAKVEEIKRKYCELLDSACNHITFDFYCTVAGSNGDYRKKYWEGIKHKYRWGCLWRFLIKVIVTVLPIAIYVVLRVI